MENPVTFVEQARVALIVWKPVLLTIVAIGIAMWFVLRGMFAHQLSSRDSLISNKDSLIALRDGEISDYKRKLDGASPEEARARIVEMESQLKALAQQVIELLPRQLTLEQRAVFVRHIEQFRGNNVAIVQDAGSADAAKFGHTIEAAFASAGWDTRNGAVMGGGPRIQSGIGLMVENPSALNPPQQAILAAFAALGINAELIADTLPQTSFASVAKVIVTNPRPA